MSCTEKLQSIDYKKSKQLQEKRVQIKEKVFGVYTCNFITSCVTITKRVNPKPIKLVTYA